MRFKILSAVATLGLLAGCQSAPVDKSTMIDHTHEAPPVPGSPEDFKRVGDRVFFDFDRSTLAHDDEHTLNMQAEWLKKYPAMALVIAGHADTRGTTEYNLALGERRAEAAKRYLATVGVEKSRVKTVSYGKNNPLVPGDSEEVHAQNRVAVSSVE